MPIPPAWLAALVRRPRLSSIAWWVVFAAAAATLQALQRVPFDADTAYHIAVARLLREQGMLEAFPWTPWSYLADHYADKELLFHLLLVPLARLRPGTISLVAGTALGALVLGTVRAVLRAEGTRAAGAWALVTLACSGGFLVRVAVLRPHLLAIVLALGITWAAARGRAAHGALLGLLFPLSYIAWHQALFLVALAALAALLGGRPPAWRAYGAIVAGLAAGVLLHPNFPENVRFLWVVNVDILFGRAWSNAAGFDIGGELRPLGLLAVVKLLGLPIVLAGGAAALAARHRREDPVPLAFALAALAYLVITLRSQRFLEYFVPFAVTAAGLAARWAPARVAGPALGPAVLAVSAAYTALLGLAPVGKLRTRTELFPAEVAARLGEVVPPGQGVFTCDWELTGEMMLALPGRTFLVALDPVLFWKKDPERYRVWFEMTRSPPPRPAPLIRDGFGTRWVLCDVRPQWVPFLQALDADPEARFRGRFGVWNLFEIAAPGEAPAAPGE
jgi:hypothetical protein